MDIQLAKQTHIPALIRLLQQVGQVHHNIRPDIFPAGTQKYEVSQLLEVLADESRPIFVALEGDAVTGYCFCQISTYPAGTCSVARKELYIDDLCVDESCRNRGIATALYRHAEAYARQLGAHSVTLNVWCGNESALRFYEKMGMTPRKIMMETKL